MRTSHYFVFSLEGRWTSEPIFIEANTVEEARAKLEDHIYEYGYEVSEQEYDTVHFIDEGMTNGR